MLRIYRTRAEKLFTTDCMVISGQTLAEGANNFRAISSLRNDGDAMTFFEELKDCFRAPLDLVPLTNAAVYSFGFSIFGAPVWKCVVVGVIAFAASKLNYGRRVLSRLGVLVMIASAVAWAELTPEPHELAQRARAIATEFFTAAAAHAPDLR